MFFVGRIVLTHTMRYVRRWCKRKSMFSHSFEISRLSQMATLFVSCGPWLSLPAPAATHLQYNSTSVVPSPNPEPGLMSCVQYPLWSSCFYLMILHLSLSCMGPRATLVYQSVFPLRAHCIGVTARVASMSGEPSGVVNAEQQLDIY